MSGQFRRGAVPQPSYDFLSGPSAGGGSDRGSSSSNNNGDSSAPPPANRALRQTFRQSSRPAAAGPTANANNEELRAQLKSARYEIESLRQDKEVTRVRHDKEVREVQARAEADFKKAQASESTKKLAANRQEGVARELRELQERTVNERRELERRLRAAQDRSKELEEEAGEAQAELAGSERRWGHRWQELEKRQDALQRTMREVRDELGAKTSNLDAARARLRSREADVGALEAEVLRLRASGGDAEELATVRTQLTDQVEHIRKLEIASREQTAELRGLRQLQKTAAILEEEKRTLQVKLGKLDDVEKELDEARYQRQLLQDEKQAWAAYLQSEAGKEGGAGDEAGFDTPEAMARALRNERMTTASLMDKLGTIQPEIFEKDGLIGSLQDEKTKLQTELAKLRSGGPGAAGSTGGSRVQARLERQKALAVKEVEYLREQLKTFDSEDVTGELRSDAEEESRRRIARLEDLVGQYRGELDTANTQLNGIEAPPQPPSTSTGLKRPAPADSENDAAVAAAAVENGELRRKVRRLQQEMAEAQTAQGTLAADNSALRMQVAGLQASARTRVLALRSNPTGDFEARKLSTIGLLRRENSALRAQLLEEGGEGRGGGSGGGSGSRRKAEVVPAESLEEARLQTQEALAQVRSREKQNERLRQVFAAKSQEMREAVASLLGWNVEFQPNGKFRLTSIFAGSGSGGGNGGGRGRGDGDEDEEEEEEDGDGIERHITFHGEKGTMTIAGGPDGRFGSEIRGLIRFWVEGRNEIPGFLAAYTLENLDRGREEEEMESN